MGEFSPPLFLSPLLSFVFSYLSNIDWFYYIITKIHPPFQKPGSAPAIIKIKFQTGPVRTMFYLFTG